MEYNKYKKYKYLYKQLLNGGNDKLKKSFSKKQMNVLVDELSMLLAQLENKIQSSIFTSRYTTITNAIQKLNARLFNIDRITPEQFVEEIIIKPFEYVKRNISKIVANRQFGLITNIVGIDKGRFIQFIEETTVNSFIKQISNIKTGGGIHTKLKASSFKAVGGSVSRQEADAVFSEWKKQYPDAQPHAAHGDALFLHPELFLDEDTTILGILSDPLVEIARNPLGFLMILLIVLNCLLALTQTRHPEPTYPIKSYRYTSTEDYQIWLRKTYAPYLKRMGKSDREIEESINYRIDDRTKARVRAISSVVKDLLSTDMASITDKEGLLDVGRLLKHPNLKKFKVSQEDLTERLFWFGYEVDPLIDVLERLVHLQRMKKRREEYDPIRQRKVMNDMEKIRKRMGLTKLKVSTLPSAFQYPRKSIESYPHPQTNHDDNDIFFPTESDLSTGLSDEARIRNFGR